MHAKIFCSLAKSIEPQKRVGRQVCNLSSPQGIFVNSCNEKSLKMKSPLIDGAPKKWNYHSWLLQIPSTKLTTNRQSLGLILVSSKFFFLLTLLIAMEFGVERICLEEEEKNACKIAALRVRKSDTSYLENTGCFKHSLVAIILPKIICTLVSQTPKTLLYYYVFKEVYLILKLCFWNF